MFDDIRSAAVTYVNEGFFPIVVYGVDDVGHCRCALGGDCQSKGKHPIGREWQKAATADEDIVREQFTNLGHNIGLKVGNLLVIDIDSAQGKLLYNGWGAPETLHARTGSEHGWHFWFRPQPHHDMSRVTNRRVAPEGIDVKTGNGQVIVEPSRHHGGRTYAWVNWGAPVADLPDQIYELIVKPTHAPRVLLNGGAQTSDAARCRAYVAKMPEAISGQGGHAATWNVVRKIRQDFVNVSDNDGWDILQEYNARCKPPWSQRELLHKWEDAGRASISNPVSDRPRPGTAEPAVAEIREQLWKRDLRWITNSKTNAKRLIENSYNAELLVRHCFPGHIRRNMLSGFVEAHRFPFADGERSEEWTDGDTTRLQIALFSLDNFNNPQFSRQDIDAAIDVVADLNAYHPIREYLGGLSWDGVPRLDSWLQTYLGAEDTDFNRCIGPKFLLSAVARAMLPGCKVDTVLVLDGLQGVTKSTSFGALFGEHWTLDTPVNVDNKDAFQAIKGFWLVELAELNSMGRASDEALKSFFSSRVDVYRPSYARHSIRQPRQCVFIASTNKDAYLRDETGNRRYWPVRCARIDFDGIRRDRDQLWAETLHRFNSGDDEARRWWLTFEENQTLAAPVHETRMVRDAWEEKIIEMFTPTITELMVSEVLTKLDKPTGQWTASDEQRVGRCMRSLGVKKKRVRRNGELKWVYSIEHRTRVEQENANDI